MYELIKVSEGCYYIDCPSKIGLLSDGNSAYLIDSGNNKDAGKKALKHINARGLRLAAIYNTHSHADHIGGNRYLQEQTGCRVYAKGIECDFTNHPILEPAFLWGGFPHSELRHKFLLAEDSIAAPITDAVLPAGVELIPLPGHSFDMVGFKIGGCAFIADCLSSPETLDKYGIGFIYDVEEYLKTLDSVGQMQADIFIPSHAAPTDNIAPLAEYNKQKVISIAEQIADICKAPKSFDAVLDQVFRHYSLTMTHEQYVLIGSTVRSYLAYLHTIGEVIPVIDNNRMLFARI
jgi:glyoxylase-like metal-dependent hydrolase (beta-lactamase superfamily II)